jgi:hypothetical protein
MKNRKRKTGNRKWVNGAGQWNCPVFNLRSPVSGFPFSPRVKVRQAARALHDGPLSSAPARISRGARRARRLALSRHIADDAEPAQPPNAQRRRRRAKGRRARVWLARARLPRRSAPCPLRHRHRRVLGRRVAAADLRLGERQNTGPFRGGAHQWL